MILKFVLIIFFFIAFILLGVKGYRNKNIWCQLISLNSFIAGSNSLKEVLPSNYNEIVDIVRIIIGLLIAAIFLCCNIQNRENIISK